MTCCYLAAAVALETGSPQVTLGLQGLHADAASSSLTIDNTDMHWEGVMSGLYERALGVCLVLPRRGACAAILLPS